MLHGLNENEVSLILIDEEYWKLRFVEEKEKIEKLLFGNFIAIEHVGSTSIPGIMAKPIVDIAIGIENMKSADFIKHLLEDGGYEYRPNHGDEYRLLFIKAEEGKRTYHIHVELFNGKAWENHVKFRDCLLCSPELRYEYTNLKLHLAKKYSKDRSRYTAEKATFIQNVLLNYGVDK